MSVNGTVFNIQRFSTHDGPGIRTTVFFQGCPLRCFWCQNPESQSVDPVLMYNRDKCISCGHCIEICPNQVPAAREDGHGMIFDRSKCVTCGKCAEECPVEALTVSGYRTSAEEVIDVVMKDYLQYIDSGGGITLSGGEALLQPEFAREILKMAKENGLNTLVETAGIVPWKSIEMVLPYTDIFYWDIKKIDSDMHKKGTGATNSLIFENAKKLAQTGKEIHFRMPLIPGFNDNEDEMEAFRELVINDFNRSPECIDLLRYNNLGETKYLRLGEEVKAVALQPQSEERVEELTEIVRKVNNKN